MQLDKLTSKDQRSIRANNNGQKKYGKVKICELYVQMTEHWSLLTHMDTCVVIGDILGTKPSIGMGDTNISLVQS